MPSFQPHSLWPDNLVLQPHQGFQLPLGSLFLSPSLNAHLLSTWNTVPPGPPPDNSYAQHPTQGSSSDTLAHS